MEYTEFQLRLMGGRPREALRRWPTLTGEQRWTVIIGMASTFDLDFASKFNEFVKDKARPGDFLGIVTARDVTVGSLTSAGFKKRNQDGRIEIWMHPSGREIWRHTLTPKAIPPEPANPKPDKDPDVEDAQNAVTRMEAKSKALKENAKRVMSMARGQARTQAVIELLIDNFAFVEEVQDLLDHQFPDWMDQQTPANLRELEKSKAEMSKLIFQNMDPGDVSKLVEELKVSDPKNELWKAARRRRGYDD